MQPKNQAERRKAFLNFLFVFIICIAVIITTVFFSIQVPFKRNDQLEKQMNGVEKEKDFSKRFTTQMIGISRLLDSINLTSPPETDRMDQKIKDGISELDHMTNDSINNKELYLNVTHNLLDVQNYLKLLREKTSKDVDVDRYKKEIKEAQDKALDFHDKWIECLTKK